jgi:hypothetical protein
MRDRWGGKTVTDTETPESSMAYPEAMTWPLKIKWLANWICNRIAFKRLQT